MKKAISKKSQQPSASARETAGTVKAPVQAASPTPTAAAPRSEPAQPRARGPVKSARPAISLEFVNPAASEVYVAGTFNGWRPEATPLKRGENGRWIGDLAVQPGRYEYLFVVDGEWVPDPNAKEKVQNPFGGENCVLSVAG